MIGDALADLMDLSDEDAEEVALLGLDEDERLDASP
jgi:hypothetical protein